MKETKKRSHWLRVWVWVGFFGYGGTVIALPLLHDNAQAGKSGTGQRERVLGQESSHVAVAVAASVAISFAVSA